MKESLIIIVLLVSSISLSSQALSVGVKGVSGFKSYKDKALNNWLWTNSLNKSFKQLGVGFDISFKQSEQEAMARNLEESPFQWYYVFGLSYSY